jgi:hypothetical protein
LAYGNIERYSTDIVERIPLGSKMALPQGSKFFTLKYIGKLLKNLLLQNYKVRALIFCRW